MQEAVDRQLTKMQVKWMEEKERERRIRAEKTHSEDQVHHSDQKQQLQAELLAKADRKRVAQLEEEERARRVQHEAVESLKAEAEEKLNSVSDLLLTRYLEEQERHRRMLVDVVDDFNTAVQSEVDRHVFVMCRDFFPVCANIDATGETHGRWKRKREREGCKKSVIQGFQPKSWLF